MNLWRIYILVTERQDILEKLMNREIETLRSKCFKYQRKSFLQNPITIMEADLSAIPAAGQYEEVGKTDKFHFTHLIKVDTQQINAYVNYKYNVYDAMIGITKKWYKKRLQTIIRHELIHAFVNEQYEQWIEVEGAHKDASPIFLAVLYWLGGISTHDCVSAFFQSKIYEDIQEINTYKEFDRYISKLLLAYNKEADNLKFARIIDKQGKIISCVTNNFSFANRDPGLYKSIQSRLNVLQNNQGDFTNAFIECNSYEIGCCIMPEDIKKLVSRKRNNQFEFFDYKKRYLINGKQIREIKIKTNFPVETLGA